ncbi:MAG: hypothetical protein ABR562_06405 [Thermoplasmatota archaeon]
MAQTTMPPQQVTVQDAQLSAKWDSFLQDYCRPAIQQAALDFPETRSVSVLFNDLQLRDPDLANYLLLRPAHALRVGASVLHQVDVTVDPKPKLHLRIQGLPESSRIIPRNLRSEHLGRFLALEGLVKKVTEVRPTVLEAVFYEDYVMTYCPHCQTEDRVLKDRRLSRLLK